MSETNEPRGKFDIMLAPWYAAEVFPQIRGLLRDGDEWVSPRIEIVHDDYVTVSLCAKMSEEDAFNGLPYWHSKFLDYNAFWLHSRKHPNVLERNLGVYVDVYPENLSRINLGYVQYALWKQCTGKEWDRQNYVEEFMYADDVQRVFGVHTETERVRLEITGVNKWNIVTADVYAVYEVNYMTDHEEKIASVQFPRESAKGHFSLVVDWFVSDHRSEKYCDIQYWSIDENAWTPGHFMDGDAE